jgi:hypothetical protein
VRPAIVAIEKKMGHAFVDADIAWQKTNEPGNAAQREAVKFIQASGK